MRKMLLLESLREKPLFAVFSAVGMFFVTPLIQSINTPLAFDIWFADIVQKPHSSALYIAFSVLFGIFVSLYLYSKNKCIDCKPQTKTGVGGTALGFLVGVCPACFSLIGFLLPLGGSIFLTTYSPVFLLVAIAIVIFSVYKMGGFKKSSSFNFVDRKENKS